MEQERSEFVQDLNVASTVLTQWERSHQGPNPTGRDEFCGFRMTMSTEPWSSHSMSLPLLLVTQEVYY